MLALSFCSYGQITLKVARQGGRVEKRRIARRPLRAAGEDAGLALECSKTCRLSCDLCERCLHTCRILEHGIDIDRLERGLRLGENLVEACCNLLPLPFETGIGGETILDGMVDRFRESRDA